MDPEPYGRGININELPQEVLLCVFNHLGQHDLNRAAQVCQLWSFIRKDSTLNVRVTFTKPDIDTSLVLETLKRASRLRSLTLKSNHESNVILEAVCTFTPYLRELVLVDCRGTLDRRNLSSTVMRAMIRKCSMMEALTIRRCCGLNDQFYREVGEMLPLLRKVHFNYTREVDSTPLWSLAMHCKQLEHLCTSDLFNQQYYGVSFHYETDEIFQHMDFRLKVMQINCGQWLPPTFLRIPLFSQLHTIHFHYAIELTDDSLISLGEMTNLRNVEFSMCPMVTPNGWAGFMESPAGKGLETISLVACKIRGVVLLSIAFHIPNLRALRFACGFFQYEIFVHSSVFMSLLVGCRNLETLEVIRMGPYVEFFMPDIVLHSRSLRHLMIMPLSRESEDLLRVAKPNINIHREREQKWSLFMDYLTPITRLM